MPVPTRIVAAVEVLAPQPDDIVLEVGGGPGVSADLICRRLERGRLVALDRSATATERARARNSAHVEAGRLEVVTGALRDYEAPGSVFDRALALDVNVLWTGAGEEELAVLGAVTRPGGLVVLAWGAGGPQPRARILGPVRAGLDRHGFEEIAPIVDPRLVGLTARRPREAERRPARGRDTIDGWTSGP